MGRNLYRIDDVLLRAGGACLLLVLAATGVVVLIGLAEGSPGAGDSGLAALSRHAPLLVGAALCPIALIGAGFALRRREEQIFAIWSLLRQDAEIAVPGLLANSDFERRDLERAIRFLNNRGLDHYVWDRDNDAIQDARLQSSHLHIDKCESCGASVSLAIPIAFQKIPQCPYCHDPVPADSLQERRREALELLRAEHRPRSTDGGSADPRQVFSVGLFLVLLFTFWPAAVVYAWFKWQGDL